MLFFKFPYIVRTQKSRARSDFIPTKCKEFSRLVEELMLPIVIIESLKICCIATMGKWSLKYVSLRHTANSKRLFKPSL
jgi:hypothetical protein